MTDPAIFLEIKGLSKVYGHGTSQEVIALENLNLQVKKGDFVSIIGSNGSGKTTLLNVISGAVRPTRGSIRLGGTDVTNKPLYKRASQISRVYQDPVAGTSPSMSVEQNLVLASLRGKGAGLRLGVTQRRKEAIHNLLRELAMGLENRLEDRVSNLSGGQRQALTMVMATMVRPQLLLLDEHCAALDPRMSR
ncbi:MAG: ATP-binding cassette domain-containing protein, partial [Deltaproteobacteria bacterium]|nr:ATP-binding cassette domain-containing protein [Deltaproteobacteria bacterium]